MKISEKWLREWCSPRLSTRELAERLTLAGLEVGTVAPASARLDQVVVGEVLDVAPHPQADRLTLCRVRVGRGAPLAIVCGAPNVASGLKVPTALAGARMPNGTEIRASEIRGVASSGMLCSAADLGLEDSSEGLLVLDAGAKPGTPIMTALDLDDQVLEIELTPNRGDCLSIAGIAREVSALTGVRLSAPSMRAVAARSRTRRPVTLEAPADCAAYAGRVIEDIDPQAVTPTWMRERLRRSGQRAIHPVVDVTNYVMLELGQPMHAFDLERLRGGIRVRHAARPEELQLLDGTTRRLEAGALVIADEDQVLALAGVMGGAASAVGTGTRHVFLESAWFRPETIGSRARQLGLQTESSQRFERGVDPGLQRRALDRATALLLEIAGGRPGPAVEKRSARHLPKHRPVLLRAAQLDRLLGVRIPIDRAAGILKRLGLTVRRTAGGLTAVAPSHRFDIGRECDLIEEVARITGYEKLAPRRPLASLVMAPQPETRLTPERLSDLLIDRGYQEAITYSFVDPQLQALLDPDTAPVRLKNPIASDMAVLRTTLWAGLLNAIRYNLNRQQSRVRLFEIGHRFFPDGSGCHEQAVLAGAITGPPWPQQWGAASRSADYFDLKGDVEALCGLTQRVFEYRPVAHPALHPGQAAEIVQSGPDGAERVGLIGALHPGIQAQLGLSRPVLMFELALAPLGRAALPAFREISRYPSIRRDLAIVVDARQPAGEVLDCVREAAGALLVELELFDEYRGEGIDSGRKSLALGLTLQDSSRTLREEVVEEVLARIVTALTDRLGARIRQ